VRAGIRQARSDEVHPTKGGRTRRTNLERLHELFHWPVWRSWFTLLRFTVDEHENMLLMKHLTMALLAAVALAAFAAGCSAKHKVETARLTDGLATASEEVRNLANEAVASIKAERFEEAVDTLAKLEDIEMSDEHKQAVVDALVDIQTVVTGKGASDELLQKIQEVMMKFM
jgi:hypothetical protein